MTEQGFFPVTFPACAKHCLHDVDPANCELRVNIRKYEDGSGYYISDAEVIDKMTDGSDGWYDFLEFAFSPDAFEALGIETPDCARWDGAAWVFNSLANAIAWVKRFAIDGLDVEDEPTTIESHNAPLRKAMLDRGCEWKVFKQTEHFVDKEGNYANDPIGHIRGPHIRNDGGHRNYQFSVQGPNGWLIRAFRDNSDGEKWALETATEVLACSYCGGTCPSDEDNACDGYAGDIDGLAERCEHTGMTRDELESICGTESATCICNDTDSYCPVHNGKGIEVDEPLTLVLTEEDAGELYYAFRQRGECQTRRKVAEFLRKVEARNNRQPKGEWYAEPIITEVIRDIKFGSCQLSAIFSDGSEDGLFSFYIDELSFSDSELIGKTAKEAHQLHTQRDIEYLRSTL